MPENVTGSPASALLSGDCAIRLVRSVVRAAQWVDDTQPRSKPGPLCGPTWAKVAHLCGLGSTSAIELCKALGVDPHFDCARERCEHKVADGEYCEPCREAYRRAAVEAGYESR
jgi:hypothetical protein